MLSETKRNTSTVHCVAENVGPIWEAFCLDFDLAVQGGSFEEVYAKLNDQIELYVETVSDLPEPARTRALQRRTPLSVTLPLLLRVIRSTFLRRGAIPRHDYVMTLPNLAAA